MRNSDRHAWVLAAAMLPCAAMAQPQAQGFALERFYSAAPGSGWFVLDALEVPQALGAGMSLSFGEAGTPLRVGNGAQAVSVVSSQAVLAFGAAIHWLRWRLSIDIAAPLVEQGQDGSAAGYAFTAPVVSVASHPDGLGDPRMAIDGVLLGRAGGPFRLGVSAQLYAPNGVRDDYATDGTFRAMFRLLAAGDVGPYSWAAHVGVHVRPLDDRPIPGSPRGSEILFAAAGGRTFATTGEWRWVAGPELFGVAALADASNGGVGLEGLLTVRAERIVARGAQLRARVGLGAGLMAQFGAPEWRLLFGIDYGS